MQRQQEGQQYTGRFAPSPTGDLHFGSLVAAVASYLQARSQSGQWLIRIEDIDPPREVRGSAGRILDDLERFGMRSDAPVLYQSTRIGAYRTLCERLVRTGLAFDCGCSRADLSPDGTYPGTCRNGIPGGKTARSVRLRVDAAAIRFDDRIQGAQTERLEQTSGDFVIWRADGMPAYQLAVVADDAFQGITEVVRGADLLDSTARQIRLQQCLGLDSPAYVHHPVILDEQGRKLGKRFGSDPVVDQPPEKALQAALRFLGHDCPRGLSLGETWDWAIENWSLSKIPPASGYNAASSR